MEQTKQQRVAELTDQLNRYRHEYYNLNAPSVTDESTTAFSMSLPAWSRKPGSVWQTRPHRR